MSVWTDDRIIASRLNLVTAPTGGAVRKQAGLTLPYEALHDANELAGSEKCD